MQCYIKNFGSLPGETKFANRIRFIRIPSVLAIHDLHNYPAPALIIADRTPME
jgi:hypothetical protein